jgi:lipoprotein NlpI
LELAIKDLNQACEYKKDDPIAFNSLGLAYFDGQYYEQAHEKLTKATELDASKGLYFNNLALALYYLGQHKDALVT